MVVNPSNSALPCGGSFIVDVGAESDLSNCTTGVNWYILPPSLGGYNSDAFESVSINSSGVLVGTTTNAIELNTFYTFTGKVTCSDTLLSQYFTVKLAVNNICLEVVCGEGLICNPCDGSCIEPPDVELS